MVFVACISTIACHDEKKESVKNNTGGMKVAVTPTMDCLPMILADERGITDSLGLDVAMMMFTAHNDVDTALVGGSVVAAFTDNVRAERIEHKGVSLYTLTNENLNWTLVANAKQRITDVKQMKDHIMAATKESATGRLGQAVLDSVHLTNEQAFMIPVNAVDVRYRMLIEAGVDAAWLPQPYAMMAIKKGHKVLALSGYSKAHVTGVVAVRFGNAKGKTKPVMTQDDVRKLRNAYNMACDSLNKNGLKPYTEIIKRSFKLTDNDIQSIGKIDFKHI